MLLKYLSNKRSLVMISKISSGGTSDNGFICNILHCVKSTLRLN